MEIEAHDPAVYLRPLFCRRTVVQEQISGGASAWRCGEKILTEVQGGKVDVCKATEGKAPFTVQLPFQKRSTLPNRKRPAKDTIV